MTQVPCDVLILQNHRVFINGTEIGNVIDLNYEQSVSTCHQLTITCVPTSVMTGKPPEETVRRLAEGMGLSDPDARVDIDKAIQSARRRLQQKETVTNERTEVHDPEDQEG